jgi:hypothetical protein
MEPQPMWPSMPCRTTRILDFDSTATVGLFISLMVILLQEIS